MDEFDRYRAEMNEKLLGSGHLGIKRFFALDTQAYEDGALDKKTKELMGENWPEHMLQRSEKGRERTTRRILQYQDSSNGTEGVV